MVNFLQNLHFCFHSKRLLLLLNNRTSCHLCSILHMPTHFVWGAVTAIWKVTPAPQEEDLNTSLRGARAGGNLLSCTFQSKPPRRFKYLQLYVSSKQWHLFKERWSSNLPLQASLDLKQETRTRYSGTEAGGYKPLKETSSSNWYPLPIQVTPEVCHRGFRSGPGKFKDGSLLNACASFKPRKFLWSLSRHHPQESSVSGLDTGHTQARWRE